MHKRDSARYEQFCIECAAPLPADEDCYQINERAALVFCYYCYDNWMVRRPPPALVRMQSVAHKLGSFSGAPVKAESPVPPTEELARLLEDLTAKPTADSPKLRHDSVPVQLGASRRRDPALRLRSPRSRISTRRARLRRSRSLGNMFQEKECVSLSKGDV
jgi:hypothetical protein